jgi:hypothetical protein
MRELGDSYIKAEFRLHKKAKPEQASTFFVEWDKYLDQIVLQGEKVRNQESLASVGALETNTGSSDDNNNNNNNTNKLFGENLPSDLELSEEQESQLDKLRVEASKRTGKYPQPPSEP